MSDTAMPTAASAWTQAWRRFRANRSAIAGAVILAFFAGVAVLAPLIATHDPVAQNVPARFSRPSAEFWFGADELGRDVFSRVVFGSRISLAVGVFTVLIGLGVGVPVGLAAGFFPRLDNVLMRLVDVMMAFPGILLSIAIVAALGPSLQNAMIAVGIQSIPTFVRIIRASVLSLREQEFVEAARAVGAMNSRIIAQHVLPNCLAPVVVYGTLMMGSAILSAATLSFLGLGAQPPTAEWGAMVATARNYLRVAPHLTFFPVAAIFSVVLAFNFLGDGLRDALDPRLK